MCVLCLVMPFSPHILILGQRLRPDECTETCAEEKSEVKLPDSALNRLTRIGVYIIRDT